MDSRLLSAQFPRSSKYHPEWLVAGCSGGANPLWLTEWLTKSVDLRSGMRVLDLGCGCALSSIFLRKEFEVEVWAVDLWFSASENLQRIRDADVEHGVYPIHAEARSLPFANDFFDAIISIDSFPYFGTDDLYLSYLSRFVKPHGQIAIAGAGLMREIEGRFRATALGGSLSCTACIPHLGGVRTGRKWVRERRTGGLHARRLAVLASMAKRGRTGKSRRDSRSRKRCRGVPRLRSRCRTTATRCQAG